MKNKISVLGLILTASLCLASIAEANSLMQMDVKKAGDDSVNITFSSSEKYTDNAIVRKKSDNKYVILLPKMSSEDYRRSGFHNTVKDLISDIDVKSVDDGGSGYTKITLITTKPLNIQTKTIISAQTAAEKKEYDSLIAKANTAKNEIQASNVKPKAEAKPKPAAPTNEIKLVEIKPEELKKHIPEAAKTLPAQKPEAKETTKPQPKTTTHPQIEEKLPEVSTVMAEEMTAETPSETITSQNVDVAPLTSKNKKPLMPVLSFILTAIFGIMVCIKFIKSSVIKSKELRASFIDRVTQNPSQLNPEEYDNIINDTEMTWQEKYQRFLSESSRQVETAKRTSGHGSYAFITNMNAVVDEIDNKRQSLERLLTPESEEQEIDGSHILDDSVFVANEEDNIRKELTKGIKFRAFDNPITASKREKSKSAKPKLQKHLDSVEQTNIKLNDSVLYTNTRQFDNANLNVNKVTGKTAPQPTEYIVSSVDEYLTILDKEDAHKINKMKKVSNPLVSGLSKIKLPGQGLPVAATNTAQPNFEALKPQVQIKETSTKSNPIAPSPVKPSATVQSHVAQKAKETNPQVVVQSGFDIDENRGFYMVNHDGINALIGKVKDEVFVLKKFDGPIDAPLQVRKDKDNVYMVKTKGFKSLVEVDSEKMGVLVEL